MSSVPATSTSRPNFASIFNVALESYRRKTKKDLASHPLLPRLQSCGSPEAILDVFREQIPVLNKSQNIDGGLTEWVIPTVNVLHSSSDMIGQAAGIAFPPASMIFAGISVLISAAKDASACQDKLIDVFNRIKRFIQRLDIYTDITPTAAMTDMIIEIMVEIINILAIATKEVKIGRFKKYFRKLVGNTDIEDSLERLDKLTQEEARMASTEALRVAHSIDDKVMIVDKGVKGVGDSVKVVEGKVQDVRSDVQDVGNKVQGIEESVHATQDDVKDVGCRVRIVGNDIKDISSEVRDLDDKLDQVKRDQLRHDLFQWLSPPDPSVNHNTACKARHSGTAQWFFQGSIFNEWKSTGSFMWIHGKPGSGKSILCSAVIQNIAASCDAGKALMAYFYFDFRDVNKQNLSNLLPSLLIQFSTRSNSCFDILSQLYSGHDHGVRKPSDRAMMDCLKEMLSLEAQGPTYIIIDALDECPVASTILPSPREEVLELVEELVGLHLQNLHICVTSRPEHDIQVTFEPLTERRRVSLHDETGQQEDIANYVAFFVDSNRRMQQWRKEDKDLVIKTLSEKADGMFRWAFCQLEVLRHCFPPSVRRILDDLPETLDKTYERILREIRKPNKEHAHRMLQCLAAAVRPLRVEELAEILAFDFDADSEGIPKLNLDWRWENQEEAIMSACSSLVIIVEDGDSRIVQFSHFSVKEFLMANRLAKSDPDVSCYHIQLDAAHTILAQACLGVIFRIDDRIDRDKIKSFPLALYAGQYWTTHAQSETVSSRIKDGMERVFDAGQPHFAIWLWLYDEEAVLLKSLPSMRPEKPQAVPLYYAAKFGFRDLAEHLIVEHPDHINARGGSKETPMHAAAGAGHINVLSLLLEHGVDVDVRNKKGETPLLRASWAGKREAGWYLIDRGADINAPDERNFTPIFVAFKGHVESARMLLERGAVIDIKNSYGETPLHQALRWGEIELVRLFLDHGADPNLANRYGDTPSELALRFDEPEIVKLLSEYGAEPVDPVVDNYSTM